jgi:hypothetical protein
MKRIFQVIISTPRVDDVYARPEAWEKEIRKVLNEHLTLEHWGVRKVSEIDEADHV